jgi:hypothetical protein
MQIFSLLSRNFTKRKMSACLSMPEIKFKPFFFYNLKIKPRAMCNTVKCQTKITMLAVDLSGECGNVYF